jgi:hypothetical protein
MDTLVLAVGPAFAAGFAIQRLLEIIDPLLNAILGARPGYGNKKRVLLSILSLLAGFVVTLGAGVRVLEPFGGKTAGSAEWVDVIATALVISAGTEGVNSVLKFLGYAKENEKAEAASKVAAAPPDAMQAINSGSEPNLIETEAQPSD